MRLKAADGKLHWIWYASVVGWRQMMLASTQAKITGAREVNVEVEMLRFAQDDSYSDDGAVMVKV